jgi:chromosome transmission fidelity protein 18
VLNDLFNPVARKRAKDLGLSEEEERRYVHRLGREVEATGSMDKVAIGLSRSCYSFCILMLASGIFEHYTSRRKHDSSFKTWQKAQEWLVTFDELMGSMRSNVDYSLMTYLAYTMVPFYPLFQERGGPRVERPKADWEVSLSLKRCLRNR